MIKKYLKFINENKNNYNQIIDYTYLKVDANIDKIKQICKTIHTGWKGWKGWKKWKQ